MDTKTAKSKTTKHNWQEHNLGCHDHAQNAGVRGRPIAQNEIDIGKSLNWPLVKSADLLKDYLKGLDVVIMANILVGGLP